MIEIIRFTLWLYLNILKVAKALQFWDKEFSTCLGRLRMKHSFVLRECPKFSKIHRESKLSIETLKIETRYSQSFRRNRRRETSRALTHAEGELDRNGRQDENLIQCTDAWSGSGFWRVTMRISKRGFSSMHGRTVDTRRCAQFSLCKPWPVERNRATEGEEGWRHRQTRVHTVHRA